MQTLLALCYETKAMWEENSFHSFVSKYDQTVKPNYTVKKNCYYIIIITLNIMNLTVINNN